LLQYNTLPTPQNIVLFEKPFIATVRPPSSLRQPVIGVLTEPDKYTIHHPNLYILISYFHLIVGLECGPLPSNFQIKMYSFLKTSHTYYMLIPSHPTLL
jgi:hypothetical protein